MTDYIDRDVNPIYLKGKEEAKAQFLKMIDDEIKKHGFTDGDEALEYHKKKLHELKKKLETLTNERK